MIDECQVTDALAARGIVPDTQQRNAIGALVVLLGARTRRSWPWQVRAMDGVRGVRGVYCHGLPGRGKSLVVDTVFELATCPKRRIHFHEFLREMNQRLVRHARGDDRLGDVAREWLDGVELLCFDEFHVHDIADAFLMGRFLEVALKLGTRIVLTSNYAPAGLLPNPEFHARFQPAIELIDKHFTVIHFDGARDYRLAGERAERPRFFAPLDTTSADALEAVFLQYEADHVLRPRVLLAAGRPLHVRAAGNALVWTDFQELCVASRSHLDYLDMAERWRGLIVDRVATHWLEKPETLQRFVWLIDIFYDRKRALFMASDRPVAEVLNGLEGAHDLSRTLSRLADMQSRAYPNPLDGVELVSKVTTCPS
ncbi:cell division protein ZapE [Burkholderia cepacia]|uniref:cell division protein ZapE n=1 Tax=Burkholderia cepacia TaxID=292 RepID=UPI0012961BA9|nr:cell division protein ZapE [Burkholderia cepacia]MCE4128307.1 cell division protein ZapE [Burkholderia cepacia]NTX49581.1 cell division protein ZapE [Burkholderia cepacia]QFS36866.1 AFG1-like ATPa [Burkholderia cepacia]